MKYLLLALLVLFLFALLFPRKVPGLLRRAGRQAGDLDRMRREIATGVEVEGSPLARYEVRAGEIVEMKVLADYPTSSDPGLQAEVRAIGCRLAEHAMRRRIPYRFSVVESDAPNAFAVPGGAIFITRPLIELCEGAPDRVACVLGHEIIHIDRRHAIRNLVASMAVERGFQVITLGRGALLSRLAGGIQQILVQGYRQDQEIEADRFGVRIARLAGFDPRGIIELFERLREAAPDGRGPLAEIYQYFKSHPPIAERIERVRREIG